MKSDSPHFLLFSESNRTFERGQWRFVLQSLDGSQQLEAADIEPDAQGERLELLAVVRGLEALPQPSHVTLVTPSRYVSRGLNYGLADWRSNDWQWERFGEMAPVKNRDLWQRIDRALKFHSVDCRLFRFDTDKIRSHRSRLAVGSLFEQAPRQGELHAKSRADEPERLAGPHYLRHRVRERASTAFPRSNVTDGCFGGQTTTSACDFLAKSISPIAAGHGRHTSKVQAMSQFKPRNRSRRSRLMACHLRRRWTTLFAKLERRLESIWLRLGQFGTRLIPPPWIE